LASQYVKLPKVSGGGGGGGAVDSFNGRTGVVVSQAGDYSGALISNTPAGTISSTNVQSAINELDGDVQSNTSAISSLTTQVANKQPLDSDLTAIAALSTNGLIARTGSGTASARTLTAGANIQVTNGDGVSGNPTVALSGIVPIANGGTNLSTVPANGQLLIGNGTNYTLAQLIAGTGISVVNGAGTITLINTAPVNQNIDGGSAASVYGGTEPINGGNA
jgi:hypothetical protein